MQRNLPRGGSLHLSIGQQLDRIVQKTLELATSGNDAVDVTTIIEPVLLFPDQAVPSSLLMAEGMTNAMKYISSSENKKPELKIGLAQAGDTCSVSIENSGGASVSSESTGLGTQLITASEAFPAFETEFMNARHEIIASFCIFDPETPLRSERANTRIIVRCSASPRYTQDQA
ncbi:hypothetical protein [Pseudophaeobacter sp.]|uniref:hypothetical protein n=1 Tax=Pseudophaeobacter sp. TaxID=1971739 RepID=UPI0032988765